MPTPREMITAMGAVAPRQALLADAVAQELYRAHRDIRGGPFMVHTMAGIDIALWDLAGKLWNTPVYRLLGGPTREKIRVYHTAKAKKIPPGGPYEHSG